MKTIIFIVRHLTVKVRPKNLHDLNIDNNHLLLCINRLKYDVV